MKDADFPALIEHYKELTQLIRLAERVDPLVSALKEVYRFATNRNWLNEKDALRCIVAQVEEALEIPASERISDVR